MKTNLLILFLLASICANAQSNLKNQSVSNRTVLFNDNWLFSLDNNPGASSEKYDDNKWRKLDLPHDWSIEDLPNQIEDSIVGPFSKAAISHRDGGFLVGGTAWYRKHFKLDNASNGKKVIIQFDGVYMNSDVWINGHHLGNYPNGYTSFYYDLTPYLKPPGQENVIAVQVKNEGHNSRWYSGSGIYRHVWLTVVNPLHFDIWGTYITTPTVSDSSATVSVETKLHGKSGDSSVTLLAEVYEPSGQMIGKTQQILSPISDENQTVNQNITVTNPKLWSVDEPQLYKVKVTISQNGKVLDERDTPFGIRSIHFDAQTGFSLNGISMKLKGGCIHHDNGPLGAVAIDRAEERKIELLKKEGYNAVRISHNPPSSELLDACDRLGMLVINEAFDMWERKKSPDDYHLYFNDWAEKDLQSMILRDRNHPSIIMWSIGNEIPEGADSSGYATGKRLAETVRKLDTTRPVTQAIPLHLILLDKTKTWDDTGPAFENVDVAGYNYSYLKYESDHKKHPDRIMYASEYFPTQGIENWLKVEKLPYVIGAFSWTAMDYLGEAGLGAPRLIKQGPEKEKSEGLLGGSGYELFLSPAWPIFNAYTGELDLIGNKKVNSYYLDVVWRQSKVEVLVHKPIPEGYQEANFYYNFPDQLKSWSFPGEEGNSMQVFVYSRAEKVTLELNGKVIGEQNLKPNDVTVIFEVPYTPGILVAKSFLNGQQTGADTLQTVGEPIAIRLIADRSTIKADRRDLSFVQVEVVDANGDIVPFVDDQLITFKIKGEGEIAGVGNGNPADVSSFQLPQKKVFHGRGLVIIRPNGKSGKITLEATAKGLKSGQIEISSR